MDQQEIAQIFESHLEQTNLKRAAFNELVRDLISMLKVGGIEDTDWDCDTDNQGCEVWVSNSSTGFRLTVKYYRRSTDIVLYKGYGCSKRFIGNLENLHQAWEILVGQANLVDPDDV